MVLNELNRPIYTSPDLTTKSDPVPFSVPLDGVKRVRIVVTLHPYEGVPLGDQLVMAQMGIAGLKFESAPRGGGESDPRPLIFPTTRPRGRRACRPCPASGCPAPGR